MSKLYCPFGCEFDKPIYGVSGLDYWIPFCPECEAPLEVQLEPESDYMLYDLEDDEWDELFG